MSDRSLLEDAAKAAGLQEWGWMGPELTYVKEGKFATWNPLQDDAQALRLAVKLGMEILPLEPIGVLCVVRGLSQARAKEPYGDDRNAATRRAITRAAAAISSQNRGVE